MVTVGSNWTFSLYEEVSNDKLLKNDTRFRAKDNGRRILIDQRPKWTLQRDCILSFYEWNSINHVTNQIALIQGSNALEFLFTYNLVHILSMAVFLPRYVIKYSFEKLISNPKTLYQNTTGKSSPNKAEVRGYCQTSKDSN